MAPVLSMMPLERFSERDIAALTAHSKTIGWYEAADWEDFIGTGEVFGHRLASGEIVSSAYLGRFGGGIGWIGAFIVNPRLQGKGLGKTLLERCLSEHGCGGAALGLVSTEEGKPLYHKSGFVDIGSTCKLVSETGFKLPDRAAPAGYVIREAAIESDRAAILRLDLEAVGFDRARLLDVRIGRAIKAFVSADAAGAIVGFISGALDSQRLILGPLIAPNTDLALSLITRLSRHWNGCMRIDIPHWQPDLVRALLKHGFRRERVCPIMTYERKPLPATSSHYFSLVGQAFG
jgi:GNAT superfamily N-acetyltransferase